MMRSYIKFADRLSVSMGKAFSWCIVILMGGTCYEVFMAYALNAPTLWNFDFSLQMYGAIFMMAGAIFSENTSLDRCCFIFYFLLPWRYCFSFLWLRICSISMEN